MKNINWVKIVKIGSIAASVLGTIGTAWVATKENEITLTKLVNERLANK